MISALKNRADIIERKIGEVAYQINGNMASKRNIFASALSSDVLGINGEVSGGFLDDNVGGGHIAAHADNILHGPVDGFDVYLAVDYLTEGCEAFDYTLDLADVALY